MLRHNSNKPATERPQLQQFLPGSNHEVNSRFTRLGHLRMIGPMLQNHHRLELAVIRITTPSFAAASLRNIRHTRLADATSPTPRGHKRQLAVAGSYAPIRAHPSP